MICCSSTVGHAITYATKNSTSNTAVPKYLQFPYKPIGVHFQRLDALDQALSAHAITKRQYDTSRGSVKTVVANWLGSILGGTSESKTAYEFIFKGLHRDKVLATLVTNLGESDAHTLMTTMDELLVRLPGKAKALDAYLKIANDLKNPGSQTQSKTNPPSRQRAGLKTKLVSWLAIRLNIDNGTELAHDYIYDDTRGSEVLDTLTRTRGEAEALGIMTSLQELKASLTPVRRRASHVSVKFPFDYKKQNLVRDFVPPGYAALKVPGHEQTQLLSVLAKATPVNGSLDVLSLFTEKPSPSRPQSANVYVVFRDEMDMRGLAHFLDGNVVALRTFIPYVRRLDDTQ